MVDEFETEEQRVEAMFNWWKQNKGSVISGLVIGVAVVVGWNYWKSHKHEQSLQASGLYQQILSAATDKKNDAQVESLSNQIMGDYSGTEYPAFAALFLAKSKADAGDLDAAYAALQKAYSLAPYPAVKNLIKTRILRLLLAQNKPDQVITELAAIDQSKVGQYESHFEEIKGDALVVLNRPNEARTAYERAKELGLKSGFLRMKIEDLSEPETIQPES